MTGESTIGGLQKIPNHAGYIIIVSRRASVSKILATHAKPLRTVPDRIIQQILVFYSPNSRLGLPGGRMQIHPMQEAQVRLPGEGNGHPLSDPTCKVIYHTYATSVLYRAAGFSTNHHSPQTCSSGMAQVGGTAR